MLFVFDVLLLFDYYLLVCGLLDLCYIIGFDFRYGCYGFGYVYCLYVVIWLGYWICFTFKRVVVGCVNLCLFLFVV